MGRVVRFLLAFAVALVLMLCFRALAFTLCTVGGDGLEPTLWQGDRVLVNRWSYGLRVGGSDGLFSYGRLGRQAIERGDLVAFDDPRNPSSMLICRCRALPGDTVWNDGVCLVVPGRITCSDTDYYWLESVGRGSTTDSRTLGFIAEEFIIGRAMAVVYSLDPSKPLMQAWRASRMLLPL